MSAAVVLHAQSRMQTLRDDLLRSKGSPEDEAVKAVDQCIRILGEEHSRDRTKFRLGRRGGRSQRKEPV
jgi:hypothetical protein